MNLVGAQIGKYKITQQIGSGSFGTVCLAHDICLNSDKAIKILSIPTPNDYLEKITEAQILDKCRHKNIISINEANVFNYLGSPVLVIDIEFANGGSIESIMQTQWISIKRAVNIANEVLFGLDHAHTQGFLHRDIKPANILIANNTIKLSDFGLAQYTAGGFGGPEGYISHLAPESFSIQKTSVLTDIYAMGITLYRMANNINDWRSKLARVSNWQHCIQNGSLLKKMGFDSFIPEPIRRIISKACNANPNKRYQSAQEMQQALSKLKFGKNWNLTSYYQWVAKDGKDKYQMTLAQTKKGYEVIYTKNGRRQNDKCCSFNSESESVNQIKKIVCEETLA